MPHRANHVRKQLIKTQKILLSQSDSSVGVGIGAGVGAFAALIGLFITTGNRGFDCLNRLRVFFVSFLDLRRFELRIVLSDLLCGRMGECLAVFGLTAVVVSLEANTALNADEVHVSCMILIGRPEVAVLVVADDRSSRMRLRRAVGLSNVVLIVELLEVLRVVILALILIGLLQPITADPADIAFVVADRAADFLHGVFGNDVAFRVDKFEIMLAFLLLNSVRIVAVVFRILIVDLDPSIEVEVFLGPSDKAGDADLDIPLLSDIGVAFRVLTRHICDGVLSNPRIFLRFSFGFRIELSSSCFEFLVVGSCDLFEIHHVVTGDGKKELIAPQAVAALHAARILTPICTRRIGMVPIGTIVLVAICAVGVEVAVHGTVGVGVLLGIDPLVGVDRLRVIALFRDLFIGHADRRAVLIHTEAAVLIHDIEERFADVCRIVVDRFAGNISRAVHAVRDNVHIVHNVMFGNCDGKTALRAEACKCGLAVGVDLVSVAGRSVRLEDRIECSLERRFVDVRINDLCVFECLCIGDDVGIRDADSSCNGAFGQLAFVVDRLVLVERMTLRGNELDAGDVVVTIEVVAEKLFLREAYRRNIIAARPVEDVKELVDELIGSSTEVGINIAYSRLRIIGTICLDREVAFCIVVEASYAVRNFPNRAQAADFTEHLGLSRPEVTESIDRDAFKILHGFDFFFGTVAGNAFDVVDSHLVGLGFICRCREHDDHAALFAVREAFPTVGVAGRIPSSDNDPGMAGGIAKRDINFSTTPLAYLMSDGNAGARIVSRDVGNDIGMLLRSDVGVRNRLDVAAYADVDNRAGIVAGSRREDIAILSMLNDPDAVKLVEFLFEFGAEHFLCIVESLGVGFQLGFRLLRCAADGAFLRDGNIMPGDIAEGPGELFGTFDIDPLVAGRMNSRFRVGAACIRALHDRNAFFGAGCGLGVLFIQHKVVSGCRNFHGFVCGLANRALRNDEAGFLAGCGLRDFIDPNVIESGKDDLDRVIGFFGVLDITVGIGTDKVNGSSLRAADVDVTALADLVGIDGFSAFFCRNKAILHKKSMIFFKIRILLDVRVLEGAILDHKLVIRDPGHGRYAVFLHDNFFMVADGADIVLGLRDLINVGAGFKNVITDLVGVDPLSGVVLMLKRRILFDESGPQLFAHGLGLLVGRGQSNGSLAVRALVGSRAFDFALGSHFADGNRPIVRMRKDGTGFSVGATAVGAGVSNFAGIGAGSRGVRYLIVVLESGILDRYSLNHLTAAILAIVDLIMRTGYAASRLIDIFLNGLISGDMLELIDGEGDDGVAVDAAIDLSAGSFAGRRDLGDGGLRIELMSFADMFDIAGADLIEGLLDGGNGVGDTGDGGSVSLSGDVLGADEASDLIEDGLNVCDDGIDIGAIAGDVKGADDRIDISLDFSHLRSEIGEGSGKVIEFGIEESGHLRAKLIPIDDGTTIRAGAEVVGFGVDMLFLTGSEQDAGDDQHKQSNHSDH